MKGVKQRGGRGRERGKRREWSEECEAERGKGREGGKRRERCTHHLHEHEHHSTKKEDDSAK